MINLVPRILFRFVVLVLFQVLILNNIRMGGYINPQLYILFILLMPFETPPWLVLTSGLLLGFSIDLFTFTYGFHSFATVIMSFARLWVLKIFSPRDGYESGTHPRIQYYGFTWFLKYAAILVIIHHMALFYIELHKFSYFFLTLGKVIISSLFSLLFIIASQYLVFKR